MDYASMTREQLIALLEQQQPLLEKNNNYNEYSVLSSTSTSSSIESNPKSDKSITRLRKKYRDCLGREMPNIVLMEVQDELLTHPWQYIAYALEEASRAPRPSWAYASAIIRRLNREKPDPADLIDELPL